VSVAEVNNARVFASLHWLFMARCSSTMKSYSLEGTLPLSR
jgi:hypothetical protein